MAALDQAGLSRVPVPIRPTDDGLPGGVEVVVPTSAASRLVDETRSRGEGRVVYQSNRPDDGGVSPEARVVLLDTDDQAAAVLVERTQGGDSGLSTADIAAYVRGLADEFGPLLVETATGDSVEIRFLALDPDRALDAAVAIFETCSAAADFSAPGDEVEEDEDWEPWDNEDYYAEKIATALRQGEPILHWWD